MNFAKARAFLLLCFAGAADHRRLHHREPLLAARPQDVRRRDHPPGHRLQQRGQARPDLQQRLRLLPVVGDLGHGLGPRRGRDRRRLRPGPRAQPRVLAARAHGDPLHPLHGQRVALVRPLAAAAVPGARRAGRDRRRSSSSTRSPVAGPAPATPGSAWRRCCCSARPSSTRSTPTACSAGPTRARRCATGWCEHLTPDTKIAYEPVIPDAYYRQAGFLAPAPNDGNRWNIFFADETPQSTLTAATDTSPASEAARQFADRLGVSLLPNELPDSVLPNRRTQDPGVVGGEGYTRDLSPALLDVYRANGVCYVVSGSIQAQRALVDPSHVPQAARLLPRAAPPGQARLRREPLPPGQVGEVQLRLELRLLPARVRAPRAADDGLEVEPLRLSRHLRRQLPSSPVSAGHRYRPPAPRRERSSSQSVVAGHVSPNPLVGAVVVKDGDVVGEGWHAVLGGPHAEVAAIADAGDTDLKGATLYVSLEPCCHDGRTPPCTDAIARAGIGRVVVASDDPTEKASGRGPGDPARRRHRRRGGRGRARRPRAPAQPGLPQARAHGAPVGAVQVGHDPRRQGRHRDRRLQVDLLGRQPRARPPLARRAATRSPSASAPRCATTPSSPRASPTPPRQPRRIIFDTTARLPVTSNLVRMAPEVPLTVVVSRAARRTAVSTLETAGADVVVATGANEPDRVASALTAARRLRDHLDPARGRPAPGRRLLRRRRGRRGPPVPRAHRARRPHRPRPARGRGHRDDRRGHARAHAGLRAQRRRPAGLSPPARMVNPCSPGSCRTGATSRP